FHTIDLPVHIATSPFSFVCDDHHRQLHSFPTRRSSDLTATGLPTSSAARPTSSASGGISNGLAMGRILLLLPTTSSRTCFPSPTDRKSTRLNSSHEWISYAVFCLKKKSIVDHDTMNPFP